uniref:Allorecognition 2 n=1 Tax=Panagrolaimus davidi TaxID=227884 RepID=A0A914NXT2_9BILA
MFFNTVLSAETKLSPSKETLVKFNEDIEFIVSPTATDDDKYVFRIHDEKGNFEIKSIKNDREDVNYDFEAKTFTTEIGQLKDKFEIEIIVNIQYTKNQLTFINVPVYVTVEQMKNLKLYEYFEIPLDLPGHRYLKLICYVKCVEEGLIQIHIKNPYNGLTVQGMQI